MPATPPGGWIRLHVGVPRNRKVRPLSDAAFRLYIELLCWAKEEGTDGLIEADMIATFGRPPKVWKELRARGLLADAGGGDLAVHDFLEWQESAEESTRKRQERKAAQSLGGARGNHDRWHVQRGLVSESCPFCTSVTRSVTDHSPDRVTDRPTNRVRIGSASPESREQR